MKKVLYLANVYSHFTAFHMPFMQLLLDMGTEVHAAASNVNNDLVSEVRAIGIICHEVPIPRNPFSFSIFKAYFSLKS